MVILDFHHRALSTLSSYLSDQWFLPVNKASYFANDNGNNFFDHPLLLFSKKKKSKFLCCIQILLFNWNMVDLQCCINFCCIAKRFSYTFFFMFFSIMVCHKTLNIGSCATQYDLTYLFYIQLLIFVNLSICIENRLIGAKGEGLREGWSGAGDWG